MRVEEAALAVVDGAIGEHEQLGALANALCRLLPDALDRALVVSDSSSAMSIPRTAAEHLPEVLEHVGVLFAGNLAVRRVPKRRQFVVTAQDDREGRSRSSRCRVAGSWIEGRRAEQRAGREVLDLALAVDRRVGDHRDGLLEVIGEVLALRGERGQGPS